MSIRTVTYTLGGEKPLPPLPQYGGVRYEDNATRVEFIIDEAYKQNIQKVFAGADLVYRIDFNSLNAGYNPSANLEINGNIVSRDIPFCMTYYGEQISAVLVITALDSEGKDIATILSPEIKIYFDNVSKDAICEKEVLKNISAMESQIGTQLENAKEFSNKAESEANNAYNYSKEAEQCARETRGNLKMSEESAMISENAAERCEKIAEELANRDASDEKYELIETVTVTEAVDAITRNTEPNGTPYSFKDVFIRVTWNTGKTGATSLKLTIKSNGKEQTAFATTAKATNNSWQTLVRTIRMYNHILFWFSTSTSNMGLGNYVSMPLGYLETDKPIDELILLYGDTFPIGTKIEIWGVRA